MKKQITQQVKRKIEMLCNDLIDTIDVDLLSPTQKIAYLKAIQPFVMPKLESIKQENEIKISKDLEWLIDQDELEVNNLVNERIKLHTTDKRLA